MNINWSSFPFIFFFPFSIFSYISLNYTLLMQLCLYLFIYIVYLFFSFLLPIKIDPAFPALPWRGNRSESEHQKIISLVWVYKFLPAMLSIGTFINFSRKTRHRSVFSQFPTSPVVWFSPFFEFFSFAPINFCHLTVFLHSKTKIFDSLHKIVCIENCVLNMDFMHFFLQ